MRRVIVKESDVIPINKIYVPFVIKALLILFLAGVGWNRLDTLQTKVHDLEGARKERVSMETTVLTRLVAIETRLSILTERLSSRDNGAPRR